MTKKKDLRRYPDLTMTMCKFMSTFYNVKNKDLNKLTHKDLKEIFSDLKSVSIDEVTDEKLVTGDIILVIDSKNKILGYPNPYIYDYYEKHSYECDSNSDIDLVFTVDDDIDELKELKEEDLDNLNKYELEKLLKLSRENQEYKVRRLVQKTLYFNKDNHSTKKEKQEKIRIREMREDDIK